MRSIGARGNAAGRGRLAMGRLLDRIKNPGASPVVTLVTPHLVAGEEE